MEKNNRYIVIDMDWFDNKIEAMNDVIKSNDEDLIYDSDIVFNTLIDVQLNSLSIDKFERAAFIAGWMATKNYTSWVSAYRQYKENKHGE